MECVFYINLGMKYCSGGLGDMTSPLGMQLNVCLTNSGLNDTSCICLIGNSIPEMKYDLDYTCLLSMFCSTNSLRLGTTRFLDFVYGPVF
jgi:hypothetical protein